MQAVTTPPAIVGSAEVCPEKDDEMKLTDELREQYEKRFRDLVIDKGRVTAVAVSVGQLMRGEDKYKHVSADTSVPWHVIGLIHLLECGGDWSCHLFNGDPLDARTVRHPRAMPVSGTPPFSWEFAAAEAIKYEQNVHAWDGEWSTVADTLFKIEGYNGFGYARKNLPSPYLWAGSQWYRGGKFVEIKQADGTYKSAYKPDVISKQLGAAVILRRLVDLGLVTYGAHAPVCEVP